MEYPTRVANLFDVLVGLLSSENPFLIYQGMYALLIHFISSCSLLGVVRSFSTCRIGRQRQVFSKIVQDLTPFLVSYAYQLATSLPAVAEDNKPLLCEVLHRAMSVVLLLRDES